MTNLKSEHIIESDTVLPSRARMLIKNDSNKCGLMIVLTSQYILLLPYDKSNPSLQTHSSMRIWLRAPIWSYTHLSSLLKQLCFAPLQFSFSVVIILKC